MVWVFSWNFDPANKIFNFIQHVEEEGCTQTKEVWAEKYYDSTYWNLHSKVDVQILYQLQKPCLYLTDVYETKVILSLF